MDACRLEIGQQAAQIIVDRIEKDNDAPPVRIALEPTISYGNTLRRP